MCKQETIHKHNTSCIKDITYINIINIITMKYIKGILDIYYINNPDLCVIVSETFLQHIKGILMKNDQ